MLINKTASLRNESCRWYSILDKRLAIKVVDLKVGGAVHLAQLVVHGDLRLS